MQEELTSRIDGVRILRLGQMADERGAVLHMMRSDYPCFEGFEEVYFSEINTGVVKAWKRHQIMVQNVAVPVGRIRLVIYDDREGSSSNGTVEELILGRPDCYYLVHIPPSLWYGFQSIAETSSLIANCTTIPHDPDEAEQLDPLSSQIPYDWGVSHE